MGATSTAHGQPVIQYDVQSWLRLTNIGSDHLHTCQTIEDGKEFPGRPASDLCGAGSCQDQQIVSIRGMFGAPGA